jgi:membrane-associated phospholipid phosphatase
MVVESLTRPYPVSVPMIVLVALIPLYVFIPALVPRRTLHAPELALDRAVPLQAAWAVVYGALYLFLIVLPVLVVRQREHVRRTVSAYLMVWTAAYVCFIVYPTVAPRPSEVIGQGFGAWGLRLLYSADPPYNCFPSLHVAHSFVSVLTCRRVHRGLGTAAGFCASLVALSTLFAKQHYILDVIAGVFLAWVAHVIFLRRHARERIPDLDRRVAPILALGTIGLIGLGVACFWVAYRLNGVA